LEGVGNRNPFIDNPAFATAIWGGPQAQNRFDGSVQTLRLQLILQRYLLSTQLQQELN
jgi:hypothetical protein